MRYSVEIVSNYSLYSTGRNEYFGFILKLLDTFYCTRSDIFYLVQPFTKINYHRHHYYSLTKISSTDISSVNARKHRHCR